MTKTSSFLPAVVGLLLLAGSGCAPSAPEASTPKPGALSHSEVTAFLINHFVSMRDPKGNSLGDLHPEGTFAYPGKRLTPQQVAVAAQEWRNDFENTFMRVQRVIIDGNLFVIEYLYASTYKPTGKRQAVGTVAIAELKDGKLIFWKEYLDGRVSRTQAKDLLPVNDQEEPFPWPDTPESRVP